MAESAKNNCSDAEIAYCLNYVVSLSKTKAAIAMGSESDQPGVIGWQVYQRPHVKAYIDELLEENTLGAKETLKLMSDVTQSNMSDYMHEVEYMDIPKVKKGLQQIIDHLQYEIEIEQEFLQLAENLSKEEIERSKSIIRSHELEITRYSIELEKNPLAYRIVDGDPILKKEMRLDLHALALDKQRGRIKSYKVTKDGVQVELQSPAVAVEMAKVHGLYEKDNKQRSTDEDKTMKVEIVKPKDDD